MKRKWLQRSVSAVTVLGVACWCLSYLNSPAAPGPGDVTGGNQPRWGGDFRSKDLSKLDLMTDPEVVWSLNFDTRTKWPRLLPNGFDPIEVLEFGKNPGLGIENLHQSGIDGSGVSVAFIDQPLLRRHEALSGIDLIYSEVRMVWGHQDTMHGVAVASLLAGQQIGVAPGVRLHYIGHPAWLEDQSTHAAALAEVIRINRTLPSTGKIRIVGFSDRPDPNERNIQDYREAIEAASQEGILVVDVERPFKLLPLTISPFYDKNQPSNWRMSELARGRISPIDALMVPAGGRTTGVGWPSRTDAYAYWSDGGMSWAVPYVVGTLALGFQVDPQMTNEQAISLLIESGTPSMGGGIINPPGYVELVRQRRKAD